jgi:hypothetical protein
MSPKSVLTIAMLCVAFLGVSPVLAQPSAPPNPLDAVPEKMPFDVPYVTPISLALFLSTLLEKQPAGRIEWHNMRL